MGAGSGVVWMHPVTSLYVQLGIACTGLVAIILTQSQSEKFRRYACLFGLAGQPLWIISAISASQWGILFVNVCYTLAWMKGVWIHWIKRKT